MPKKPDYYDDRSLVFRLFRKFVRGWEWLHFRQRGALFDEDLFPEGLSRQSFTGPPNAELTEAQRREVVERIRKRPRIG